MVAMELPSDLMEEILSWVPVKSLARLKFTCKQWETLISEPRFAEKHLSHVRCREQQFTVFNDVSNNETSWVSTVSCVGVDFDEIKNETNLNIEVLDPLPFSNLWVHSMYHCDGLLLFVTKTELLVLNPFLKQARWIKCGYSINNHSVDAYGLGYVNNQLSSSSCNEYKMVRFCCGSSSHSKIQLYEFKSNSWRDVVDKSFGGFSELPESSVCLKGTPYWIGYSNFFVTLQSFDFSKERFQTLSTPPRLSKLSRKKRALIGDFSLGVFRGDRLSLLHKYQTSEINLWVMRKKYWSNLMIIDVRDPLMFVKYSSYFIEKIGKLVVSFRGIDYISVYFVGMDDDDDEEQYAQYSPMNSSICRSVCYYVPSLLPVPGFFEAKKKVKYLSKKRKERSGT